MDWVHQRGPDRITVHCTFLYGPFVYGGSGGGAGRGVKEATR